MISSFGGRKNKKKHVISDINITPFVDVLLVLLIIFMISAPLMTSGVNIDLPKGSVSERSSDDTSSITISIKTNGDIFLQDEPIKSVFLKTKLLIATNNNLNTKIYIRADKNLDYGKVMEVVKSINMAGFSEAILVTEVI